MAETSTIAKGHIVQAVPTHQWAGALLIVDEVRTWGVIAYLRIPANDGSGGDAFIRLKHDEFVPAGAVAPFQQDEGRSDG